ncbi:MULTISPECIES: LOG family protein [Acetobacteraceae]|nr:MULTISPECIES: TIGR00730 family Rossman fold protein [Acetobacteraceae]MCQ0041442.1 TIGR00730 family Rossman fold protein [Bombella sp.]MUG78801.1 TIGR00730 family Rossman fold protein [Bombella sp. ESL0380]QGT74554.1 TIGR00730 family Rossman fold protein [Bombella sp. ESL0368]MBE1724088.1 TIGR00730 family Rossman fold protein [Bombella apis]MBR9730428.1 TIGR00730 family Rossman fold protein [Bombella apis]
MTIRSCSVFCGSRPGHDPAHMQVARALGTALGEAGLTLVYGGGTAGLMGAVADATLLAGGTVKGIIPRFLEAQEILHEGVTDLEVTEDMPSRKARLFEEADAYVILPGGFGTFDEFMEVLVNRQLGLSQRPIIILNTNGWADPLIALLQATQAQGFADAGAETLYEVVTDVPSVMRRLKKPSHA